MILVPAPKSLEFLGKSTEVPKKGYIFISDRGLLIGARKLQEELFGYTISMYDSKDSFVRIYIDESQVGKSEGYKLVVRDGSVVIIGNDIRGAFYGIMTLKQILRNHPDEIPNLRIIDYPDFPNRGFMLDISRDRVPKMGALKNLIDLLSELKYNQFQLYIEHTFAYRNHEKVWRDYSPLTSEEIIELDRYAKERMIELVPNQNSFGHLEKWLVHDEYKRYAEVEDGFMTPWGFRMNHPFSLSPAAEGVFEFLRSLYRELLPNFSSDKFNIGCDETFDLCQGKSKKLCKEKGKGRVYLEFLLKVHEIVREFKKTTMFWGDIIKNHPELVPEIPDSVIALIWGYEKDHPFDQECRIFKSSGIPFYVVPGTSSWNSIVGRVENMIGNVDNAVKNGLKYGSIGVLMTDWGDNGHWQHLPISFPGIVYASAKSWNHNADIDLSKALSMHVLMDETFESGKALVDIGNAYKATGVDIFNANIFGAVLIWPEKFKERKKELDIEKLEKAREILIDARERFFSSPLRRNDSEILKREIENGVDMAIFSIDFIKKLKGEEIDLKERFSKLVEEYKETWLLRNREGGLKQSVEKLKKVKEYL